MTEPDHIARLLALTPDDMPPETDDLGRLLDLAQARHGLPSRAAVWRSIGVHPDRGRALLSRDARRVDWPLWFCLRHAALGA